VQEIYLVNDLHVPRQYAAHQRHRPPFQCFGQYGVVSVSAGLDGDLPSGLPRQTFDVHEDSHQLRDGECRVGIVQLQSHFVREIIEVGPGLCAFFRRFEPPDDVLHKIGDGQKPSFKMFKLFAMVNNIYTQTISIRK